MSKKRFLLRIDPELYKTLEKWAADDLRSVNAQIEFLLKQSVRQASRGKKEHSQPTDNELGQQE
ncbi:MAG: hypothetical protein AAFV85_05115 [Cyanobacteria bacterium J06634_6]